MASSPTVGVDQGRVRADDRSRRRPGSRRAAWCRARSPRRARSRRRRRSRSARVDDRHPGEHVALEDPAARLALASGELGAVVDAEVDVQVVGLVGDRRAALVADQRQHVAEVVLARGVVVRRAARARRPARRRRTRTCSVLTSRIASTSGGTPSGYLVSTIRSKSPSASRTIRPSASASSRSTRHHRGRRAAPPRWASTSAAITLAATSG